MTLLPIAARELRVASRQVGTYWTRVAAAGLAIVVSGGFMLVWMNNPMAIGGNTGQMLFSILKWLCFAFVCSTGLFLTSDCLSEEKRERTMGLLFLTDLRGYDVVLGKLMASSLRAFFGLLACFPVLGLTLMAGGVSGLEFWRTLMALCNALFFSLAAGVFVSAFSRDTLKAITAVMAFCTIALAAPPLLDYWRADWTANNFVPKFLVASPAYALIVAPQRNSPMFWPALFWPNLTAWLCLALACFFVPRTWQEKSKVSGGNASRGRGRWRFGGRRQRTKWLELNPIIWLASRDQWVTQCARMVFLAFGGLGFYLWWKLGSNGFQGFMTVTHSLLGLILYIWVAAQATRFPSDARRNGALELVLCTPVTIAQMIRGQWIALLRMTFLPLLVILGMSAFQQYQAWMILIGNAPMANSQVNKDMEIYQLVSAISGTVVFLTTLAALGWFGMLMGLRSKKTSAALTKTVVLVQVLPWLAVAILQGVLMMATIWMKISFYWTALLAAVVFLMKDATFIFWSRHRLYRDFREIAAQSFDIVRPAKAPPLPSRMTPDIPPVLPA
jgi:hypothetical protein